MVTRRGVGASKNSGRISAELWVAPGCGPRNGQRQSVIADIDIIDHEDLRKQIEKAPADLPPPTRILLPGPHRLESKFAAEVGQALGPLGVIIYLGHAFEDAPITDNYEETTKRIVSALRAVRRMMHFAPKTERTRFLVWYARKLSLASPASSRISVALLRCIDQFLKVPVEVRAHLLK